MPKSNYLADKVGDILHGGFTYSVPTTTYFDAMTVSPTGSGGGTSSGMGRVAVTNNSTNWPASSGQTKTNANAINFGTNSTGSAQTIVAIAEYDASSGGNLLFYGTLSTAQVVAIGAPFVVPAGGGIYTES